MRRILFAICMISLCVHSAAQKQSRRFTDSLIRELAKAREDTGKVNMLGEICRYYAMQNPDSGIYFGKQGLELANKLEWNKGIGRIKLCLAICYDEKRSYNISSAYFGESLVLLQAVQDKENEAVCLRNIGISYAHQSLADSALLYYQKADTIFKALHDDGGSAGVNLSIGHVFKNRGQYYDALKRYMDAIHSYEKQGNKSGCAGAYVSMGNVYFSLNELTKAEEYYQKGLNIFSELQNEREKANVYEGLANVRYELMQYTEAISYHNQALDIYKRIGMRAEVGNVLSNLGNVYGDMGDFSNALKYYTEALKIARDLEDKGGIAIILLNAGRNYYDRARAGEADNDAQKVITIASRQDLEKAIVMTKESANMLEDMDMLPPLKLAYENLMLAYEMKGDYKMAYYYQMGLMQVSDTLYRTDKARQIAALEVQNQYDRKRFADSISYVRERESSNLRLQRQRTLSYAGIGIAGGLLLFSFLIFRVNKRLATEKRKTEEERRKSEELLLNILPQEVAEELKLNGRTEAKYFDDVTVLFTDFVDFTQAGERMSAQQLVSELHDCFKAFDEIISRYNIEKIKTIGDAYLAVCGLPNADVRHAERVVNAALEIKRFMSIRRQELGDATFDIRIGVHSGPVIAGIVGVKKFAYDIWGDTVNTAARMEQNSQAGKINISEATYELVKDKFACSYRGEIAAKNKGAMKMYFAESGIKELAS